MVGARSPGKSGGQGSGTQQQHGIRRIGNVEIEQIVKTHAAMRTTANVVLF